MSNPTFPGGAVGDTFDSDFCYEFQVCETTMHVGWVSGMTRTLHRHRQEYIYSLQRMNHTWILPLCFRHNEKRKSILRNKSAVRLNKTVKEKSPSEIDDGFFPLFEWWIKLECFSILHICHWLFNPCSPLNIKFFLSFLVFQPRIHEHYADSSGKNT